MQPASPPKPATTAQPQPATRIPARYVAAMVAIAGGATIALAVMILAFLVLGGRPAAAEAPLNLKPAAVDKTAAPTDAAPPAAAHTHGAHTHAAPPAAVHGPLRVAIQARHRGLRLQVLARVTDRRGRVVRDADASLYTDMVEMPIAHTKGPFALRKLPGQPGVYGVETRVPMVGEYQLKVIVDGPRSGSATKNYLVEAAGGQ